MPTKYKCLICDSKPDQLSHHKMHIETQKHKDKRTIFELKLQSMTNEALVEKYKTYNINDIINKIETKKIKKLRIKPTMIISNKEALKDKIHDIHKLNCKLKNQVSLDIKNISKKKFFKKLNFSEIPLLMGVLNVTPDSFSDGGRFNTKSKAYNQAKILVKNGCDIIDIGGESTRPGSKQILPKKEWYRII